MAVVFIAWAPSREAYAAAPEEVGGTAAGLIVHTASAVGGKVPVRSIGLPLRFSFQPVIDAIASGAAVALVPSTAFMPVDVSERRRGRHPAPAGVGHDRDPAPAGWRADARADTIRPMHSTSNG